MKLPNKPNLLLCGNGASMRDIAYDLLPNDIDIYRVNQFYNEDTYFVGKAIKKLFVAYTFKVDVKLYTLYHLRNKKEYDIERIVIGASRPPDSSLIDDDKEICLDLWRYNPYCEIFYDYLKLYPKLQEFSYFKQDCEQIMPTSGLNALVVALAEKYENIYIAGIDFYSLDADISGDGFYNPNYFFPIGSNNLTLFGGFAQKANIDNPREYHNKFIEKEFLEMIKIEAKNQGTNIYSITPTSPINELLPKAPQLTNQICFDISKITPKEEDYINDFIMPPIYTSKDPKNQKTIYDRLGIRGEIEILKRSAYVKFAIFLRKKLAAFLFFLKSHKQMFIALKDICKKLLFKNTSPPPPPGQQTTEKKTAKRDIGKRGIDGRA